MIEPTRVRATVRDPFTVFRGESVTLTLVDEGTWEIVTSDGNDGRILFLVARADTLTFADGAE